MFPSSVSLRLSQLSGSKVSFRTYRRSQISRTLDCGGIPLDGMCQEKSDAGSKLARRSQPDQIAVRQNVSVYRRQNVGPAGRFGLDHLDV